MSPETVTAIRADLADYFAELEDPAIRAVLLRAGFTRLLKTLELVPANRLDGDALQLGAEPYLLTLCLRRLLRGPLALANYFGTPEECGEQLLVSRRSGDVLRLPYRLFNVETQAFPYTDASFDLVFFCELLEHLAIDPVCALAEIHRVLRPDGVLIVTTPNARSLLRLEGFLRGNRQMVDRYAPAFGYGARHNREYLPDELRDLLERTGFTVEEMRVEEVNDVPRGARLRRAVWSRILDLYSAQPHAEHMFVRARRMPHFRWRFPPGLFDNIDLYVLARHPWVEMGVNDSIQCVFGWLLLEISNDGTEVRWLGGTAQAVLKSPLNASLVRVECHAREASDASALPVRIAVRDRRRWQTDPRLVYADRVVRVERGAWRTVELSLDRSPPPGDEIEVSLSVDAASLDAPPLAALPERHRGLCVRAIRFIAASPDAPVVGESG